LTYPQLHQNPSDNTAANILTGKVQRLGDFIDTDAVCQFSLPHQVNLTKQILIDQKKLAPAEFLLGMKDNKRSGMHCLEHTNPVFGDRVDKGFNIVVAGKGFGCGSSREQAVMALIGKPIYEATCAR
jgi:3-isopropylmalate dehydratase small subunit